jgi:hypothetical protein
VLNPSDFVQPSPGNFFHTSLLTGGEGAGLQQRHRGGGGAGRVADPQIPIIYPDSVGSVDPDPVSDPGWQK